MKEYRVEWCACPTAHNRGEVLFVRAGSVDDAKLIARDHIERTRGIAWLVFDGVSEVRPLPAGEVLCR